MLKKDAIAMSLKGERAFPHNKKGREVTPSRKNHVHDGHKTHLEKCKEFPLINGDF